MHSTFITFRNIEMEVLYVDYGYESDTNSHVIEWYFADNKITSNGITDKEEQEIYEKLARINKE